MRVNSFYSFKLNYCDVLMAKINSMLKSSLSIRCSSIVCNGSLYDVCHIVERLIVRDSGYSFALQELQSSDPMNCQKTRGPMGNIAHLKKKPVQIKYK